MKCAYHLESPAFNTCSRCGVWLCDSCAVDIDGKLVCKKCVANAMNMNSGGGYAPHDHGHMHAHAGRGAERTGPRTRRYVSGLWIFLLSGLPGLNYMAMGLMKRGLFFMSAFFGLVYLINVFHALAAFPIVILFFASICDAQSKRRRINSGEYVSDDVDDILRFAVRYKSIILVVLGVLAVSSLVSFGSRIFWHNPIILILVCLVGWYFIKCRSEKKASERDSEHRSHSHHDN